MKPGAHLNKRTRTFNFTTPNSQARLAQIMALLERRAMTVPEISHMIGINLANTANYVNYLFGAGDGPKRIYVWSWLRPVGGRKKMTRKFKAGDLPDRARPTPFTEAELGRRRRAKVKANPERLELEKEKKKIRDQRRPSRYKPPPPDPLVALFFGMTKPSNEKEARQ